MHPHPLPFEMFRRNPINVYIFKFPFKKQKKKARSHLVGRGGVGSGCLKMALVSKTHKNRILSFLRAVLMPLFKKLRSKRDLRKSALLTGMIPEPDVSWKGPKEGSYLAAKAEEMLCTMFCEKTL